MQSTSEQASKIRRTIRDLIALSALPAVWVGYRAEDIAESLADALLNTFPLEFVYLRFRGQTRFEEIEVARTSFRPIPEGLARELAADLAPSLRHPKIHTPQTVPNPLGDGSIEIVIFPLGFDAEEGLLVAGYRQANALCEEDRLLLSIGANQAAMVLQRRRVEEALRKSEQRLAFELASMGRLQEVSTHLVQIGDTQSLLHEILDAAIAVTAADMGNIQLFDRASGALKISASRGFERPFLDFFNEVHSGNCACGAAMRRGERIIIDDVTTSLLFIDTPALDVMLAAGARAVQSTPLVARCGDFVGMLSTHYRAPHRPSDAELNALDLLARQAADWLERMRAEDDLRLAKTRLEKGLAGSNIGVWEIDLPDGTNGNGHVDFTNVWEQLGYVRPERPTDFATPMALVHPDDRARTEECIQAYLCGKSPSLEFEHRALRKDGEYRWLLVRGIGVRDFQGNLMRLIGSSIDVTEQKRTQAALHKSEERFRRYFDLGLVGMAITSPSKGCIEVNNEICQILGYDRQEMLSKSWAEMTHPDDLAADVAQFDRVAAGEIDGYVLAKRWIRKDGEIVDSIISVKAVRLPSGELDYFVAMLQDVTERNRAENALRESERRFRGTFENAAVGIAHADENGRILQCNRKYCDIVGYTHDEMRARTFKDITHPDDLAKNVERYEQLWQGNFDSFSLEKRYLHKFGGTVWVDVTVCMQRSAEGRPTYTIAIAQDISERKRAEDAVRVANERLNLAMRGSNIGIWEIDIAGGVQADGHAFHNNFWEQLGYSPNEFPTDIAAAIAVAHPDDRERIEHAIEGYLAGEEEEFVVEYRALHKDGKYRWLLSRGVAIRGETGTPIRFTGTMLDITERKRQQAELERAKDAAEAANRAKDEFLANVSHEIRSPLNAIQGMTELVLASPLSDDQQKDLETVASAADNLLAIINGLLDFSRIESGKLELYISGFSMHALIREVLRSLAPDALAKDLELAGQIEPSVPDAVIGDDRRLRQVLLNLVGNAIKFTEYGTVALQVAVASNSSQAANDDDKVMLQFTVSDTGIGIMREKLRTIFEAFEQEDASITRKYGGTGLGLTIASRLVGLMGGQLTVDSEVGRGSVFSFSIPVGVQACGPVWKVPPDPVIKVPPLRILVAEDNDFNQRHLRRLLEQRGHAVTIVNHGREVLNLLQVLDVSARNQNGNISSGLKSVRTFDLLLLDLHMPELDGLQTIAAIRVFEESVGGHLPVIILTARTRREDRDQCLAAGSDGFLAKPVRAAALFAAIDEAMRSQSESGNESAAERGKQEHSLINPRVLLATCGGDDEMLAEMCSDCKEYTPARMTEVFAALAELDAVRLREAAHKLCGLLSAFSSVVGNSASHLEDLAANGDLEAVQPVVDQLDSMTGSLIAQLDGLTVAKLQCRLAVDELAYEATADAKSTNRPRQYL